MRNNPLNVSAISRQLGLILCLSLLVSLGGCEGCQQGAMGGDGTPSRSGSDDSNTTEAPINTGTENENTDLGEPGNAGVEVTNGNQTPTSETTNTTDENGDENEGSCPALEEMTPEEGRRIQVAIEESIRRLVIPSEGTSCERAWSSLRQVRDNFLTLEPELECVVALVSNEDVFLENCNRLPENIQNCMIVSYALAHEEECAQAQENLTQEQLEIFEATRR